MHIKCFYPYIKNVNFTRKTFEFIIYIMKFQLNLTNAAREEQSKMAISFTNSKSARKSSSKSASSVSKRNSPLPESDGECPRGGNHSYQMYGRPYECCVKCGKQHSTIIEWRRNLIEDGGTVSHPYLMKGIWSDLQYRKYMAAR